MEINYDRNNINENTIDFIQMKINANKTSEECSLSISKYGGQH